MVSSGPEATRAELLYAAALEISERGYSGASFSSVAARLGLTKGAFAYHFPTKRALAVALMEDFAQAFQDALDQARQRFPNDDLRTALHALRTIEIKGVNDPIVAAAFTLMLDPQPPVDQIHEKFGWWVDTFTDFLKNAQDAGQVQLSVDLDDAAEFLIISLVGLTCLRRRTFGDTGAKDRMHLQLLFRSLGVNGTQEIIGEVLDVVHT